MEKQPINIWGKPFCELPNGNLCDACCNVKEVSNDPSWKKINKIAGQDCQFMKRVKENGQGCALYGLGPNRCDNYHCSIETESDIKLKLINYALEQNLVSLNQAEEAVKRLIE